MSCRDLEWSKRFKNQYDQYDKCMCPVRQKYHKSIGKSTELYRRNQLIKRDITCRNKFIQDMQININLINK